MSLVNKPDYEVFASNARDGEVLPIPNVLRGWGETILLTERIPPMEWFNWLAKRQDEWLLYLTQQGIAEWSEKVTYPTAAITKLNSLFYVSLKETKGDNPANTQASWKLLTEYFNIDGKLDKTSVVQTTGQSTTNVMSQKAVTDAIPAVPKNTALKSDNGWWKCADTGIIYQWGTIDYTSAPGEKDYTFSFNIEFPNNSLNVSLTRKVKISSGARENDGGVLLASHNKSNFTVNFSRFSSDTGGLRGLSWFAIGY